MSNRYENASPKKGEGVFDEPHRRTVIQSYDDCVFVERLEGDYTTDGICDGCGEERGQCRMRFADCMRRARVAALAAGSKP